MKTNLNQLEFFSPNLWKRLLTGFILVIVIVSSVLYSSYSFIGMVMIINILGTNEFYILLQVKSLKKIMGLILSFTLFLTSSLAIKGFSESILVINIPVGFSFFLLTLYDRSEKPFTELAIIFLGIIYITIPCILLTLSAFLLPNENHYNPFTILGLFCMTWANDSGAYLTGKLFGKHSLFKRVSPAKTWEGVMGGTVSSLVVAAIFIYYSVEVDYLFWIPMALIIIIAGPFGDLIKSRLKRSLNVKDSGNILPGHGGILDRFDALLCSAAFVACYSVIIQIV